MIRLNSTIAAAVIISVTTLTAQAREINFSGTISLPNGQPAVEARVRLFYFHCITGYGSGELAETTTDELGVFAIEITDFQRSAIIPFCGDTPVPPALFLIAEMDGYGTVFKEANPAKGDGHHITLAESVTVHLRAVNTSVRPIVPIPNARLWVTGLSSLPDGDTPSVIGGHPIAREIWSLFTDENGYANIDMPLGSQGTAIYYGEGAFGVSTLNAVHPGFQRRISAGSFRTEDTHWRIRGRVTLDDGETPGAGMVVTYGIPGRRGIITTPNRFFSENTVDITDENGRFEIGFCLDRGQENILYRGDAGPLIIARDPSHDPQYSDTVLQLPANWKALDDIEITMVKGRPIEVNVRNKADGTPLPHSTAAISPSDAPFSDFVFLHRLADERGMFRARVAEEKAVLRITSPPAGLTLPGGNNPITVDIKETDNIDIDAAVAPEAPGLFRLAYPDGRPAAAQQATVLQRRRSYRRVIQTDEDGITRAPGLSVGEETLVEVDVRNVYGAFAFIPEMTDSEEPTPVTVYKIRRGFVRFVDEQDNPIQSGRFSLMREGDSSAVRIDFEGGLGRVNALIPGIRYRVEGTAPGYEPAVDQRGGITWSFNDDDPEPILTLRFRKTNSNRTDAGV